MNDIEDSNTDQHLLWLALERSGIGLHFTTETNTWLRRKCRRLSPSVLAGLAFDPKDREDINCWVRMKLTECQVDPASVRDVVAYCWQIVKNRFFGDLGWARRHASDDFTATCVVSTPDRRRNNDHVQSSVGLSNLHSDLILADSLVDLVLTAGPRAISGLRHMRHSTLAKCLIRFGWEVQQQVGTDSEVYRQFVELLVARLDDLALLPAEDQRLVVDGLKSIDAKKNHRADFAAVGIRPPDSEAWTLFRELCTKSLYAISC